MTDIVSFALETGMRRAEIVAARWVDVNWTAMTLAIPVTKNGDPRTIPLTPAALDLLSRATRSTVAARLCLEQAPML